MTKKGIDNAQAVPAVRVLVERGSSKADSKNFSIHFESECLAHLFPVENMYT